jgi:hypothetical protein
MDKNKEDKDRLLFPLITTFVLILVFFWAFKFVSEIQASPIADDLKISQIEKQIGAEIEVLGKTDMGYDLGVKFSEMPVRKMELRETDLETVRNIHIENIGKKDRWQQLYIIDPTGINFTNATVTVTAVGNSLYKCRDWDDSTFECYDEWELIKTDLVPGEEYSFILTKEDPLFGEGVLTFTVNFTSSGTWTVPAGITKCIVEAWGGGGAGGGRTTSGRAGGGGGGAYARMNFTVSQGQVHNITVAASVAGGTVNGANGNPTYFDTGASLYAAGGSGGLSAGTGGAGGTVAASKGDVRYAGGNGGTSDATWSGGGGGGAGSTGAGGNANVGTAGTGTSELGGNGGAGLNANNNGNPGSTYGGGGGGARRGATTNRNGGAGAAGFLRITYIDTALPVINSISDAPDPVEWGNKINFTANVTDNVAVGSVRVSVGGANRTMAGERQYNYINTTSQVSTACYDSEQTTGSNYEFYSQWTISGSGNANVTRIWYWQHDATLLATESIQIAMYYSNRSRIANSLTTIAGTGASGWVSATYSTPILITLGQTYYIGVGPNSGAYDSPRDGSSNCATYLPNTGSYYSTASGGLDATVPTGTQSTNHYTIPGVTYTQAVAGGLLWKYSYNTTPLSLGLNYYTVYANDTSNNKAVPKTGNFTVRDTKLPVINSISDAPDPVDYGAKINFTANVTDKKGVSKVWIDINRTNRTMAADGTDKWYYDLFNTSISTGKYNYTVYANDTSNNKAAPKKGNFTINVKDIIPPNVTSLLTNGTIHSINASVFIAVLVKDGTAVDTVIANITKPDNSTDTIQLNFNVITARYEKTFNNTQYLGKYFVRVIANDTLGNVNSTETTSFFVVQPEMYISKYDAPDPVQVSGILNYTINYTTNTTGGIVLLDFQDFRLLTNSTFPKDSPQMIESAAGTLIIVYHARPGANDDIYVIRSTNKGANWSSPIKVTDEVEDDNWPNIYVNSGGKIIITYSHETVAGYNDVWLVDSSNDGVSWSEPHAVTTTPAISEWEPTIEEDSAGDYYVVYEASEGGNDSEIYIRNASDYNGDWSDRIAITNNTYMDVDIDILYQDGVFYFAWAPADPDYQEIWFAKTATPLVPGILDKNKTQVTDNEIYDYETSINRDNQGNIYIGWVGLLNSSESGFHNVNRTSNEVFIASSFEAGETWDIRRITNNNVSDAYPGIIQTSADGLYYISALRANKGFLDVTFAQRVFSPEDVINAIIKDKIPTGTTVRSIGQGGTQQGDSITWNFPVLYAGNNGFVSFSVTVNKTFSNGTKINNTANCTYYDLTGRLIDAINSSANTTVIDSIPPAVTQLVPAGKNFNQSSPVLISANVTDNGIITSVKANITIPGDGTQVIQLLFNTSTKLYQGIFTNTSTLGVYYFTIIANDTAGNVNGTESSYFASVNEPPTTPTGLACNGGSCNNSFNTTIALACSGSTDPDNDSIAYHIEAMYAPLIGDKDAVNAQFESGNDSFVYRDDIYGTASPAQATGARQLNSNCTGGYCLNVGLNLNSPATGSAISGGWNRTFNVTDSPAYVKISFDYALRIDDETETSESVTLKYRNVTSKAVITGESLKGKTGTDFVDEYSYGSVSYNANLTNGTYSFDVGCILSSVDNVNENGECWIDNVTITEVNTSSTLKDWREVGTHGEGSSFAWDISEEKTQTNVDLRCRAIDSGSNIFSNYYTLGGNATIVSVLLPKINSVIDAPDPVNFGEMINITANVTSKIVAVSSVWVQINGLNRTMTADGTNKWYYDLFNTSIAAGKYSYTVYANNTLGNKAIPKKGNFTVNTLISISMTNAPINFSSVKAGQTVNASISGWPVWIKNLGNVNISIKMKGRNLTGQAVPSYKINVTKVHWATDSIFSIENILTESYVIAKTNLQTGKNISFYYKLYTPYGVIQQNYRGNVTFLAVQS